MNARDFKTVISTRQISIFSGDLLGAVHISKKIGVLIDQNLDNGMFAKELCEAIEMHTTSIWGRHAMYNTGNITANITTHETHLQYGSILKSFKVRILSYPIEQTTYVLYGDETPGTMEEWE